MPKIPPIANLQIVSGNSMKKRQTLVLILLLIVLTTGTLTYVFVFKKQESIETHQATNKPEFIIDSLATEEFNVLDEILKINNDTSLKLVDSFPDGLVTKGHLTNYLTKTDWGYIIKLKSPTPVTSPSILGDTMYVSGGFGSKSYYSFNLKTGMLVWAIDLNDDGPSPAVFDDSTMIFNAESCTIFAIERFSGNMLWSHWLGDPLLSFPIVSDKKVFTSYPAMHIYGDYGYYTKSYTKIKPSHTLVCLDSKTGTVLWQKWLDGDILVTPVADSKFIYATTFPGTVYKIDKNNGKIIASISINATSPPTISSKVIYITKRADDSTKVKESIAMLDLNSLGFIKEFNKVDAPYLDYEIQKKTALKKESDRLDIGNGFSDGAPAASGWQLASKNIGQSSVSSLQLFQPSTVQCYNNYTINLMGNKIYCIDPRNENIIWSFLIEGALKSEGGTIATTPIICNNFLVTVSVSGRVIVLNLENGEIAFEKNLNKKVRTAPVVKDGYVIVPTTSGEINVINTSIKELDNWSMYMKNSQHKI